MSHCKCLYEPTSGAIAIHCDHCSRGMKRTAARRVNNGCRTPQVQAVRRAIRRPRDRKE